MSKFGLIGKNIDYSFSKLYFTKKFENEGLPHTYQNFDIKSVESITDIIKKTKELKGLNVTIPYKEAVIPFLDKLNKKAEEIGAVNTIEITKNGNLIGY
ncbi:MAG: shikimate dehydrogenase, partial [Flavobacteriaceae bacterium]|nr:shikimate dehydrogenase [Flavobacteriaceae bacterium]